MKLSSLGEFGLIELIRDAVQSTRKPSAEASRRVIIDIGDDTAVWSGSTMAQLATTDSMVEGVHFDFRWCTWEDLGYKSLAVNLSDIAAMGGHARYVLVSLSCPPDVDSDSILAYYRGMTALALEHDVAIVGGNLTSSPIVVSTVCLMGEASPERLLTRSAARSGDVVAVTGTVGGSSEALALLSSNAASAGDVPEPLMRSLLRPIPRLSEARSLVECGVRCAIDISDGVVSDLGHICERSGVSAVVHAPLMPCATAAGIAPDTSTRFALTGGEDYELLFTCEPELVPRVAGALQCPVTVIGEITEISDTPRVVVLDRDGAPYDIDRSGWRHFAQ